VTWKIKREATNYFENGNEQIEEGKFKLNLEAMQTSKQDLMAAPDTEEDEKK
jgi:hypothetical protein